jgi:glycerol-3-phosphate dehydrogenase (NAD(P)+)
MTRIAVFGAGAMGTAIAMHAARRGQDVSLWANPHDRAAFEAMKGEGRHPSLPEHLPADLALFGPDDLVAAADGVEIAIMAAHSDGARSLARMVGDVVAGAHSVVSVAKGLETESAKRASTVYGEELPGASIVAVGGPCLAPELAEGAPSAVVWAGTTVEAARAAGEPIADRHYQITFSDDVVGVEYCAVVKNVSAIGLGILDGLAKLRAIRLQNAKAALFTRAASELAMLVVALGGRAETALGLPGMGDIVVTGLGGRNRLFGELVGEGGDPTEVVQSMRGRGLTVEGLDNARHVHRLITEAGLDLPYHLAVHGVLFEGKDPHHVLEVLC